MKKNKYLKQLLSIWRYFFFISACDGIAVTRAFYGSHYALLLLLAYVLKHQYLAYFAVSAGFQLMHYIAGLMILGHVLAGCFPSLLRVPAQYRGRLPKWPSSLPVGLAVCVVEPLLYFLLLSSLHAYGSTYVPRFEPVYHFGFLHEPTRLRYGAEAVKCALGIMQWSFIGLFINNLIDYFELRGSAPMKSPMPERKQDLDFTTVRPS